MGGDEKHGLPQEGRGEGPRPGHNSPLTDRKDTFTPGQMSLRSETVKQMKVSNYPHVRGFWAQKLGQESNKTIVNKNYIFKLADIDGYSMATNASFKE